MEVALYLERLLTANDQLLQASSPFRLDVFDSHLSLRSTYTAIVLVQIITARQEVLSPTNSLRGLIRDRDMQQFQYKQEGKR